MVGMVATGALASAAINPAGGNGLIYGGYRLFAVHLGALSLVFAFVFVGSYLLYKLTDRLLPMRVPPEQESVGLDLSQHGESIFPEQVGFHK